MKKILIISTTGMGDTLWGTPAIRALKKFFPQIDIDLLLQPQWQDLFTGNPYVGKLIPYLPQWYRQILEIPNFLKNRYDHVLIFHANKCIARILPWLRCSSIWSHQYAPERDEDGNVIGGLPGIQLDKIIQFEKPVHAILRRLALLKEIKVPSDGTHMDIFLKDNEKEDTKLFLKKHNIKTRDFIYLNIGGSASYKQWPINKFVLLSKAILQKTSLSVVLGGGPEDTSRIDDVRRQLDPRRVTHASNRSIRENCALISQAKILITPDSGPMHIGYALKVPTIRLFWSINNEGIQRDVLNGPDYCGPLDIDKSLSSVISGSFMQNELIDSKDPGTSKIISVEDVWNKIVGFL